MLIDASESQWDNIKAVGNGRDGIYVRNVHNDMLNNFDAYNNGRHGINVVAMITSNGCHWKSCWNGRLVAGNDVNFKDDGAPTWGYGISTQSLIDGIIAGPIKGSLNNIQFHDNASIAAATEEWAVYVWPNLTGFLTLLNVKVDAAGTVGAVNTPTTTGLVVSEIPGGTKNVRLTKGNIIIGDATCSSSAAPAGTLRLGANRLWVDDSGKLRMKSSDPANSTDGTVVGSQT